MFLFVGLLGVFNQFDIVFAKHCESHCGMIPPVIEVLVQGVKVYGSKVEDWVNGKNLGGMEIIKQDLGLEFFYIFFPGREKPHYFYVGRSKGEVEESFCLDGVNSGRIEINVFCGEQGTAMGLIPLERDSKIEILNNFWRNSEYDDVYLDSRIV